MTENTYDKGDSPRLKATFTVNDVPTAPDVAVLIVRAPDGVEKSYLSAGFSDQGNWDPANNTPELADGTGTAGHYYTATAAAAAADLGSGSQAFAVGDRVFYDGDIWLAIPKPQSAPLVVEDVGIFYYDLPVHEVGRYRYRFEGAGLVHAAGEGHFEVRASKIR